MKKDDEIYPYKVNSRCFRLSGVIFIVTNQNGFNAALYEYYKPDEHDAVWGYDGIHNYSKKELRSMVSNYPNDYPALIAIEDNTFEIRSIGVDVLPKSLKPIIRIFLLFLKIMRL